MTESSTGPQTNGDGGQDPALFARFQPIPSLPPGAEQEPGRWYVFGAGQQILLTESQRIPIGIEPPDGIDAADKLLIGVLDDQPCWALTAPEAAGSIDLRGAFAVLGEAEWAIAGRAAQLLGWARDHAFCGRCGSQTTPRRNERARGCQACGLLSFPRLTPAVIMLVEREDGRALLGWGRQFPGRFFSALAGFVEPGESLERAVEREIAEEVGVQVTNVRYFGSQPWPFPHSLMIGFQADYAGGEIIIQEEEIVEAGWYSADDLPPVPTGRMSIAAWLIEDWVQRQQAKR